MIIHFNIIYFNFCLSGSSKVVRLLDHFPHFGPHGRHMCLVFEPMGKIVFSLKSSLFVIWLKSIKKINYYHIFLFCMMV